MRPRTRHRGIQRVGAPLLAPLLFLLATPALAKWQTVPFPELGQAASPLLLDSSGRLWAGEGQNPSMGGPPNAALDSLGGYVFDDGRWQRVPALDRTTWTSAAQDSAGNIWIGTMQGLFKFDGGSWTRFTVTDGLIDNRVLGLIVDRRGRVWAGSPTNRGVSVFDGTWKSVPVQVPSPPDEAIPLCVDSGGDVWFTGFDEFAYRFDGATWSRLYIPTAHFLGPAVTLAIAQALDGTMWFARAGSVAHLTGDSIRVEGPDTAEHLIRAADGTLWCIGADPNAPYRMYRLDQGVWRASPSRETLFSIGPFVADPQGGLWKLGLKGLERFTPEGATPYTETRGDPYCFCWTRPYEDVDGSLWFPGLYPTGGYAKFDGNHWTAYTSSNGLAPGVATEMLRDRHGSYWFATWGGLTRFDGSTWTNYPTTSSFPAVRHLAEDSQGRIWRVVGTGIGGGARSGPVSYFDGVTWNDVDTTSVQFPAQINSVLADRRGNVWFIGQPFDTLDSGVTRFDGATWTHYGAADGPGAALLLAIHEDREGNIWFAGSGIVSRFDGSTWTAYPVSTSGPAWSSASFLEDSLGSLWVTSPYVGKFRFNGNSWVDQPIVTGGSAGDGVWGRLLQDRAGRVWSFGDNGVFQFDGTSWRGFGVEHGLPELGGPVGGFVTDITGALWFGGPGGTIQYSPDVVAPIVQLLSQPPAIAPTGSLSASCSVVYEVDPGSEYSWRLDGGPWSEWSTIGIWNQSGIPDGRHVLEVRARDYSRNVGPAARVGFEVDATPPVPAVAIPRFGDPVRGIVDIIGTTVDARFASDSVWVRPSGASSWSAPTAMLIGSSFTEIAAGNLATWDTSSLPDGDYDLRVSVTDSLGLTGTAQVTVIVDNHAPYANETAPTKVAAATGGDIYTTNAETHLYFPPHAFAQDAIVTVTAVTAGSVPPSLPSDAAKALDGYELAWSGTLKKPARFTLSYAGVSMPPGTLALYRSSDGTAWERLGGTVDPAARSISLAVSAPGRYALFADDGLGTGAASLSPIAFTPRVFSPNGGFANTQVGISFTLGRPAPVTVKVFSESGRLIREVASGLELNAGDNLIRWDGTDRNGGYVTDGMYLVTVEALGRTEKKALAVVK